MATRILDGVLIKKPHTQETYTEDAIDELMKCASPVDGHHYFLENYFYIQHPVKGKLLFEPYDYQKRLIDAYHNHRFTVNLCPRQ